MDLFTIKPHKMHSHVVISPKSIAISPANLNSRDNFKYIADGKSPSFILVYKRGHKRKPA